MSERRERKRMGQYEEKCKEYGKGEEGRMGRGKRRGIGRERREGKGKGGMGE